MKKNLAIFDFLRNALRNGESAALITVVQSNGHAPGKTGFKMAVTKTGLLGTVGGGAIEFEAINIARNMLRKGERVSFLLDRVHDTRAKENSSGMICGGWQKLAFNILLPKDECSFSPALDSYAPGKIYEILICETGITIRETSPDYASYASEHSFTEYPEGEWLYREIAAEKDIAYIFGGGHVSQALVPLLRSLFFRIVVIDEREYLLKRKSIDADELLVVPFKDGPRCVEEGKYSYAFIMTPGHVSDEDVLRELLKKDIPYIGMMASKRKAAEIVARLKKEGFAENDFEKVRSPIGLSIKSRTPEEIAVSIAAEVIQIRNKDK